MHNHHPYWQSQAQKKVLYQLPPASSFRLNDGCFVRHNPREIPGNSCDRADYASSRGDEELDFDIAEDLAIPGGIDIKLRPTPDNCVGKRKEIEKGDPDDQTYCRSVFVANMPGQRNEGDNGRQTTKAYESIRGGHQKKGKD